MKIKLPNWLTDERLIIGAEGENDPGAQGAPDPDPNDDDNDDDEGDPEEDDKGKGSSEHDDANDPKVKGLKTALATERRAAKALERENRRLKAAQEELELKEKTDLEQATIKLTKSEERNKRLADGLLKRDLDDAIRREAEKAGFVDVTDALAGVDRTQITVSQDDDDPTDIEIDLKSVTAQVKGLAARKPHFIRSGTDDGEPTGSQFGGSKQKKKTSEEALRSTYPSL